MPTGFSCRGFFCSKSRAKFILISSKFVANLGWEYSGFFGVDFGPVSPPLGLVICLGRGLGDGGA